MKSVYPATPSTINSLLWKVNDVHLSRAKQTLISVSFYRFLHVNCNSDLNMIDFQIHTCSFDKCSFYFHGFHGNVRYSSLSCHADTPYVCGLSAALHPQGPARSSPLPLTYGKHSYYAARLPADVPAFV